MGISYPSTATNSFSYNGADARVGKTDSAGTWTYKRDGTDPTDDVLSDGFAAYTPAVSRHPSSGTTFEGGDSQGTNRIETNSSQSVSGTRVYDAFGNLQSTTGTPQGPFGYVGQSGYQEDADSGLKLLGHRYYDPSSGRFLTRDFAKDGRNWYDYCENSPIPNSDPTGFGGPGPTGGPPPFPVPRGFPGNGWKWNPDSGNRRGGTWGPIEPVQGRLPTASWDPIPGYHAEPHWDLDHGVKGQPRTHHDKNGVLIPFGPPSPRQLYNPFPVNSGPDYGLLIGIGLGCVALGIIVCVFPESAPVVARTVLILVRA